MFIPWSATILLSVDLSGVPVSGAIVWSVGIDVGDPVDVLTGEPVPPPTIGVEGLAQGNTPNNLSKTSGENGLLWTDVNDISSVWSFHPLNKGPVLPGTINLTLPKPSGSCVSRTKPT